MSRISESLYCTVYVDSSHPTTDQLAQCIGGFCEGRISFGDNISAIGARISVMKNDEYDPKRAKGEDGFLYFRYYLEVEPTDDESRDSFIKFLSNLLQFLWSRHFDAVAACSFEGELPVPPSYRSTQ